MKREELIARVQATHARVLEIERRLASRTGPPAPGDVYLLKRVEWLLVREHPDDPTLVFVVPVDDNPMRGSSDVSLEPPQIARCCAGAWVHAAVLRCRVDFQPDALRPVQKMMAKLARGQDTGPGRDDGHPAYERAMDRLVRKAEQIGDLVVFEDGNCPGMVYQGTSKHWDGLLAAGGFPIQVHPARVGPDGLVDSGPEGRNPIQRAPDHWLSV